MSTNSVWIGDAESQTIEVKQTYELQRPGIAEEIAKDVAAMASAEGGTLWVGVIENAASRTASGFAAMTESDIGKLQDVVEQAIKSRCVQPVKYDCKRVAADGLWLLAIAICRQGSQVSARIGNGEKSSFVFPVRVGTHTKYQTPEGRLLVPERAEEEQIPRMQLSLDQGDYRDEAGNLYCPRCYQSKDTMSLRMNPATSGMTRIWKCSSCQFSRPMSDAEFDKSARPAHVHIDLESANRSLFRKRSIL